MNKTNFNLKEYFLSDPASILIHFKVYIMPFLVGLLTAILAVSVLQPKTNREYVTRGMATLVSSCLFGRSFALIVSSNIPFVAENFDTFEIPLIAIAGLPAWWVLGAMARYLEKNADDILNKTLDRK